MKHIKHYRVFEASPALTPEQIEWLNKCTSEGEGQWVLNDNSPVMEVNVYGSFSCSQMELKDFKGVRFGTITHHFRCSNNQLTTLQGAPYKVGGDFSCQKNLLTSLEGAPEVIEGIFDCRKNLLTSLEGAPRSVGWYLDFEDNPVSEQILDKIFSAMKGGESYPSTLESLWPEIPLGDKALLYRPEFKWIGAEEAKKLQAVGRFNKIKGML
jgi:hypothetical protein